MADTLKSLTPIALAAIGGAIACGAMFSPNITNEKFAITMGVVTAFASGAAGLASPQKEKN